MISIPAKIFRGEIPDGAPDLVGSGLIEHRGDAIAITAVGRSALSPSTSGVWGKR